MEVNIVPPTGCAAECAVRFGPVPIGVNPRGETDLNDTRAIGLSLGRSLPSRG